MDQSRAARSRVSSAGRMQPHDDRKDEARWRPARALAFPAWWIALAVLAVNDHWLKGSGLVPGLDRVAQRDVNAGRAVEQHRLYAVGRHPVRCHGEPAALLIPDEDRHGQSTQSFL